MGTVNVPVKPAERGIISYEEEFGQQCGGNGVKGMGKKRTWKMKNQSDTLIKVTK